MPKDTFHNLKEEKKQRILAAAIEEFSRRRFSDASINQIVKNAGISRGSFYQYFTNKEDLYLYMINEIGKEKVRVLDGAGAWNLDADFFTAYMYMYHVALRWVKEKPQYNRIFMLMEFDDCEFIGKLRELSVEGLALLRRLLERDQQRGLVRPDVDPGFVIEIVYQLMLYVIKEYYQKGSEELMLAKVENIFKIIKEGIGN
ncbi:MAG: TetR/AcrR family transcriptional regulator [bacterium]|jgi:TetR/AcrR family transcriptional regulator